MCIPEDTPIPIQLTNKTIHYKIVTVHRRAGNQNKCIWTITPKEEVDCFQFSASNDWLDEKQGWGLKSNKNGSLDQIGLSTQKKPLKIAKFVDTNLTCEWHGYPADYCKNSQDVPSCKVLEKWKKNNLISKTNFSKIRQRKPCNL